MVSQRRLLNLLTLLILLSLFAVACERPLGGTDDGATEDQTSQTEDPNAGGGLGDVTTTSDTTETAVTDSAATDTTTTDEAATEETTAETGAEETETTSEEQETTAETETPQDDSAEAGGGVGDVSSETTEDTAQTAETETEEAPATETNGTTIPATHTVAAGENLYRIGLKYGISWIAIARENMLSNPNVLSVGQVLKLPGGTPTEPPSTPSPQTETTYIVQPGDNLFRIGLKYGISWIQIAEANGLVNPNLILVGYELKIPVNAPGPVPQFSHVVKPGETLFLISLQYGVAWPSIAEANSISSPYIIYVGQTLVIPGS